MNDVRPSAEAPSALHPSEFSAGDSSELATASVEESVELAVVTRAGVVESRHIGSAVVVGPDGQVLESIGAPQRLPALHAQAVPAPRCAPAR